MAVLILEFALQLNDAIGLRVGDLVLLAPPPIAILNARPNE